MLMLTQFKHQVSLGLLLLSALSLVAAGCKPKTPTRSQAPQPPQELDDGSIGGGDDQDGGGLAPPNAVIEILGYSGNEIEVAANQELRLALKLTGADAGGNFQLSLARMPLGGQLLDRNGQEPQFVWTPSVPGEFELKFIAREMDVCRRFEAANPSQCQIPETLFGSLTPDERYDISRHVTLRVISGGGVTPNPNPNPIPPPGGGNDGGTIVADPGNIDGGDSPGIIGRIGDGFGSIWSWMKNLGRSVFSFITGGSGGGCSSC